MSDPELVRLQRQLLRRQARLKKALSPEAFVIYLDVDATVGAILNVFGTRVWKAARARKTKPRRG